jgi:phosphoribosyl 1,2-cyclic phosphate phosphodiesterase
VKVRILGCGTSSGVPRIGNDWGACDPAEPRNRRTRASLLVEHDGVRILVDTGPDMREQLLAADVAELDAIIWTHDHADHCHGIDDVRQIFHAMGRPVRGYARPNTLDPLRERFTYVFAGRQGYPPTVEASELPDSLTIGGITVDVVDQPHGSITSAGLRFSAGGGDTAMRLDVWIVDALRYAPHPTHPDVPTVLQWIEKLRPHRSAFIHMDHSMDYATLVAALPPGVQPGYDGLEFAP